MTQQQSISLCACGCGRAAPIAQRTRSELGHIKGQPIPYINGHNWRGRRRPKLSSEAQAEADERRLFRKFLIGDGCWEWTGARNGGYGVIKIGDIPRTAHRVFYEMRIGPVPKGLELHHRCENKCCVRPDHLMMVTRKQHQMLDGRDRSLRKTCLHGHPYTPENTNWRERRGKPVRVCRACQRRYNHERSER